MWVWWQGVRVHNDTNLSTVGGLCSANLTMANPRLELIYNGGTERYVI